MAMGRIHFNEDRTPQPPLTGGLEKSFQGGAFQQALLILLILSTAGGQLLRIPYLSGTGILVTDLILAVILPVYLMQLLTQKVRFRFTVSNLTLLFFLGFSLTTLLFNSYFLPDADLVISFFYLLRFSAYLALFFVAQNFSPHLKTFFHWMLIATGLITLFGFLQLAFFPNFEALGMQDLGWDPHINRLLSTWFDPNFIGGFLVFSCSLIAGVLVQIKNWSGFLQQKINVFYLLAFCGGLGAIILTYSRSSYLALVCALFLLGLIASRKLIFGMLILGVLTFGASERLQTRVLDAFNSAEALLNAQSVETLDATARYRLASWENGLNLFAEKPFFGHGYNTLRYLQSSRGYLIGQSHAAGGFDSSLLTLLVTNGIIGFGIFMFLIGVILYAKFKNYRQSSDLFFKGLNLGYFCGLIGLLIHSFFVNSLLFPLMLVFLWLWAGLLEQRKF